MSSKKCKTPCLCDTCLKARNREVADARKFPSAMSITGWREHGIKHGYWKHLEKEAYSAAYNKAINDLLAKSTDWSGDWRKIANELKKP